MVGQTVKAPTACRLFLERLDQFFLQTRARPRNSFTKRFGSHETRSDWRVVVAGGSVVSFSCGEQGALGVESAGSLDEVPAVSANCPGLVIIPGGLLSCVISVVFLGILC